MRKNWFFSFYKNNWNFETPQSRLDFSSFSYHGCISWDPEDYSNRFGILMWYKASEPTSGTIGRISFVISRSQNTCFVKVAPKNCLTIILGKLWHIVNESAVELSYNLSIPTQRDLFNLFFQSSWAHYVFCGRTNKQMNL